MNRLTSISCTWFAIICLTSVGCDARRAFPKELTEFVPIGEQPVFAGNPGHWDAFIRERGWIVIDDGVWKLYYTGYSGPDDIRRLGLATSRDGLTWTRHSDEPLVKDQWIEDMTIVKDGGQWHMFAEGKDDQAHSFVSNDGLEWTRVGPLDVRMTNGQPIPPGPYGTPAVFKGDDAWYLLYERSDKGVWLARSEKLDVWKHVQDEPVMTPGPGEYDKDLIAVNQVVKHKGKFYAFYHGCKNDPDKTKRRWCPGVAESTDLIHWRKYSGNPIVPRERNRSSGTVVPVDGGFRLYTTHPAVWAYRNRN